MTDETTALVEETTPALEPMPIPVDFIQFENDWLYGANIDEPAVPHIDLRIDADAERLMARIKTVRLEATRAMAPIDAEIAERKAHIDALSKTITRLQADVQYLQEQRSRLNEPYQQAEALYRPSLDAYLLAKIAAKPDGEKSLVFQSGQLLSVQPPPKWTYDEKVLAFWADIHLPSVVKKEPVVNKNDLKKLVNVEGATGNVFLASNGDGEPVLVPGVKVTTPPREITLEVTL